MAIHLDKYREKFFKDSIMVVDVFHFGCKHKRTDNFCQSNCNPAAYKELYDENEKWIFNSSAAEQANAWIVRFRPIVRDMLAHNFNFFLDEMIMRRNKVTVANLRRRGTAPKRRDN